MVVNQRDSGPQAEDVLASISAAGGVERLDWKDGDLLILGSSRLAPPHRLFIGSTAARILRVLQIPIVVTPGEEE